MMLDEQGASRRGSPGVGSPATGRHLKPRHRKIPVSEHRSRTREHKLVHYTHRPIPDVVRRSRGPFTHLCRAERECKSAKVTLSPARTTVLSFRCWSGEKVVLDCLYRRTGAHPHARSLSIEVSSRSSGLCRGGLSPSSWCDASFVAICPGWKLRLNPAGACLTAKKHTGCSKYSCRLVTGKAPGVIFFYLASGGHGQEQNRTS